MPLTEVARREQHLATLRPFRLDINKSTSTWTYIVRDQRNREICKLNQFLEDRDSVGQAIVDLLNQESHHG